MKLHSKRKNAITDPVCGMNIIPEMDSIFTEFEGDTYYFCAENCLNSFIKNPHKFICPEPSKNKGIWRRYLARLEKTTGGKSMKCH